ncbi:MAG TPA: flagellar motor protein MotB [Polyangiaceae bacterium]|nr:flagellar motor protein MotB [Polyangiaceae bacterium]
MAPGSGAKALAGVLLVSTGALGLYSFQQRTSGEEVTAAKTACMGKLDECTRARDSLEKAASSASADLGASRAELEQLRREKEEQDQRLEVFKSVTDKFRQMIDSGKLQVVMRHGRMVVKLPASVLFPSGSADLSKDGQTALAEVARILRQFSDRRFEVAGHTDNVPIGPPSTFKNNLELSTARAVTVTDTLVEKGMNPAHLSAAGYSAYQPVATNATEAGRQENRRIEIALVPNLAEVPTPDLDAGIAAGGPDAH